MTAPRTATVSRATSETDVTLTIILDGTGAAGVATGLGFLDHMLAALATHARLDLDVRLFTGREHKESEQQRQPGYWIHSRALGRSRDADRGTVYLSRSRDRQTVSGRPRAGTAIRLSGVRSRHGPNGPGEHETDRVRGLP